MIDEVRGDLPGLREVIYLGTGDWTRLAAGQGTAAQQRAALDRRAAELSFDDPINIQYTSGTTGFPKGATLSHHNILNNGYFVGELCRYTERDRVAIPVPFYHCFGMVMGNLACTTHGACIVIPAPGFDPAATLRAVQVAAVHRAVRGADDVHRRARPGRLRLLRPVLAADRHHGRLAVPGRGDEAGGQRDAHDRGHDLLRDDRDVAGVHPDQRGRRHGAAGVHGGTGAPAPRGQDHRPGDRARGAARRPRRAVHPRLLGHARLLGRAGQDRGGDRRGPVDAHRRPGHHGRGRLRQHRGPDQGHDHPRWRERLPARGRGVPVHPPGRRGRPGDRRAGRQVRRGAVRLGAAAPGPAT